ncbi:MAG: pyridoxal 5'-phosphate synthase glutaminase subunit PdxT [Dehalococcoidia bacterium]|jgi:pyridoxal 5'-phosphate synthase pdxT subunit|nr:pyridoxal 5'-phosphate synthase glutaminase subunit PdxT [Dehalococcoidia bacterium]
MTDAPAAPVRVGVLALQGDFEEHANMLRATGAEAVEVRTLAQLQSVDGLVIPGGESTTIARLLLAFDLMEPLRELIAEGLPVWGTCAGAILLADAAPGLDRPSIGGLGMTIDRNAFGTQVDSFETDLTIDGVEGGPFHAVFIRAPVITEVHDGTEATARLEDGRIVAARSGRLMATCFHPEITDDHRLHAAFVELVQDAVTEEAVA